MVNKRLFEVSQEEKNRILGLHESATKKQYLLKEDIEDLLKKVPKNEDLGLLIYNMGKKVNVISTRQKIDKFNQWFANTISVSNSDYDRFYELWEDCNEDDRNQMGGDSFRRLGKYLRNNSTGLKILKKIDDWMTAEGEDWGLTTSEFDPALEDPETKKRREEAELERQFRLKAQQAPTGP